MVASYQTGRRPLEDLRLLKGRHALLEISLIFSAGAAALEISRPRSTMLLTPLTGHVPLLDAPPRAHKKIDKISKRVKKVFQKLSILSLLGKGWGFWRLLW